MKGSVLLVFAAMVFGSAANAGPITVFTAILSGAAEVPPTGSLATGSTIVTLNTIAQTLEVNVIFSGLTGNTTASHIHCCTSTPGTGNAGVATTTPSFTGFPLGVTSGTFDQTYDLTLASTYNPAFVTAEGGLANAETALVNGLLAGDTYLNIHTTTFGGGEIRGFLPAAAPEPSTLLLAGAALIALAAWRVKACQIRRPM